MKPDLQDTLHKLYEAVPELEALFPGRPFTPDGHLVGSLGECVVASDYDLELMPPSNAGFDAVTPDGRQVEIKATQGRSVGFRSQPQYCIVVKLLRSGEYEEIYNGPGKPVWSEVSNRPVPSNGQYQISLSKLVRLQDLVADSERIPLR